MTKYTAFLKIPLNKLYYIDNVDEYMGLSERDIQSLKNEYSTSELEKIAQSIHWAVNNKDYDFLSLLPNLNHSNNDIHKYLCKIEAYFSDLESS